MVPMISAANVEPHYDSWPKLTTDELMRLVEPCAIHEWTGSSADGVEVHVYSIGGILDGQIIHRADGGGYKTHSGAILIDDVPRGVADEMAPMIVVDLINALHAEREAYFKAEVALARLASVGHAGRMEAALKPDSDKSDAFIADAQAIRPLIGDDVILTTGTKPAD